MKPILFNTEMVRAILDGRKTVTRRAIKKAQCNGLYAIEPDDWDKKSLNEPWRNMTDSDFIESTYNPPYQPGDILYVRETWNTKCSNCETECFGACNIPYYVYRADYHNAEDKWRPSIHMPKEAARIWLKCINVRVERLQDISVTDMKKEGFLGSCFMCSHNKGNSGNVECELSAKKLMECTLEMCNIDGKPLSDFVSVWNSTLKKSDLDCYGWDANPWVWVIEFERCGNPDMEEAPK